MKFDRNPRNQSARIEVVKQDRTRTVDRLPDRPRDGETVILRQKDNSKQICIYSMDGEWVCVSAVDEAPKGERGEQGPAEPQGPQGER